MSKYAALRDVMGSNESWNDRSVNGRILKWAADTVHADAKTRKALAAGVLARLQAAGITCVQKVVVRNAKTSNIYYVGKGNGTDGGDYLVSEYYCEDKIAVYIDEI